MQREPKLVWQAIALRMKQRSWNPRELALQTGYPEAWIVKGIKGELNTPLQSDFLHACVDEFGLTSFRERGPEYTNDILTDEECIELLIATLATHPHQSRLWD